MITIDGSYAEGGGQILRTALALSVLTGKAFEAINIRKGRDKPGLKAQHLHCIEALKQLCNAKAENVFLGSEHIKFYPGKIENKTISIDIGTAGSITLLLQSLLLPSFFAPGKVRLKIKGGTDVKWSMPIHYFTNVFIPTIDKFVEKIKINEIRHGFYPKGNGFFDLTIYPKYKLNDFHSFNEFLKYLRESKDSIDLIERKELVAIKGISYASKNLEKRKVAERQARAARHELLAFNVPIKIETEYYETDSSGSGIVLWAIFGEEKQQLLASDDLGEVSKRAEEVGINAAKKLVEEIKSNACVDKHLADNLIPFIALFGKQFKTSEITGHVKSNIYVVKCFLGDIIEIDEENKIVKYKSL